MSEIGTNLLSHGEFARLIDPEAGSWTEDDANAIAREARKARGVVVGLEDRIHALEVQQADLIRQVKEAQMQTQLFARMVRALAAHVPDGNGGDLLRKQAREMLGALENKP